MRIKNNKENIDYMETIGFFDRRAKKYRDDNPYSVTMYQDDNSELVKKRNAAEIEKLKPFLNLNYKSRVLDIACGIGRWSDAIEEDILEYCGIDFCSEFIELARKRNKEKKNRYFFCSSSLDLQECIENNDKGKFNVILLIGSLMYLNDEDLGSVLRQIEAVCEEETVICIREPIGINERLTLKEQFSDELKDNYNAIYRTRGELLKFLETAFIGNGFKIVAEDFLFENVELNNRKETAQYYYILKR